MLHAVGFSALIGLGSNLGDRQRKSMGRLRRLGRTPVSPSGRSARFTRPSRLAARRARGCILNAVALARDGPRAARVAPRPPGDRGSIRTGADGSLGRANARSRPAALRRQDHRDAGAVRAASTNATRRFVLEPLVEVAPAAVDPVTRRPFAAILADLIESSG